MWESSKTFTTKIKHPIPGFRFPFYEVFLPEKLPSDSAQPRKDDNETSFNITDVNFTRQYFECLKDECLIFDLILTMYNLDLTFNDLSFDDSLHFGTVFYKRRVCSPLFC